MKHFKPPKVPDRTPPDAAYVVANPEQFADKPLLRRMAWRQLMTQRGQRVDPVKLREMAEGGITPHGLPVEVGHA